MQLNKSNIKSSSSIIKRWKTTFIGRKFSLSGLFGPTKPDNMANPTERPTAIIIKTKIGKYSSIIHDFKIVFFKVIHIYIG